ncbi:MAG: DUF5698 domain-containing protein [Anaerolineaceae bacterium]|nr:DUF5698 domain-containing protein [Anaerolineaceae bacterium]
MQLIFTPTVLLTTLLIFVVRVASIAMDTLRFMLTMRGKQGIAWVLGFVESVLYVVTIGVVLSDLSNVLYMIGYAAGFATGNVVGMAIERRLAIGFSHLKIITKQHGLAVAEALRKMDYAVTEIPARGKDGSVSLCDLSVRRKDIPAIEKLALEVDPEAFITVEDITPLRSGYWGTGSVRR